MVLLYLFDPFWWETLHILNVKATAACARESTVGISRMAPGFQWPSAAPRCELMAV